MVKCTLEMLDECLGWDIFFPKMIKPHIRIGVSSVHLSVVFLKFSFVPQDLGPYDIILYFKLLSPLSRDPMRDISELAGPSENSCNVMEGVWSQGGRQCCEE